MKHFIAVRGMAVKCLLDYAAHQSAARCIKGFVFVGRRRGGGASRCGSGLRGVRRRLLSMDQGPFVRCLDNASAIWGGIPMWAQARPGPAPTGLGDVVVCALPLSSSSSCPWAWGKQSALDGAQCGDEPDHPQHRASTPRTDAAVITPAC